MRARTQAFTLIEVLVAVTILAVVMVSVFEVYFGVLTLNRRLEFSRSLQENARSTTEMFAKEIRERGIDLGFYDNGSAARTLDYENGNDILAIRPDNLGNASRYYLMEDSVTGPVSCTDPVSKDCYLGRESVGSDGISQRVRVTDSRVKVEGLRFHIVGSSAASVSSGTTVPTDIREAKVTAVFELGVPPAKGLDPNVAKKLKIRAQTTISEKIYKSY